MPFKITSTDRRILAALDGHDMAVDEVTDSIGNGDYKWIGRKLRRLLAAELVRVVRWERNQDGMASPVYSVTPGKSAQRPRAEGWSTWSKRYRKKINERGGEQYIKARSALALLVNITSRRQE